MAWGCSQSTLHVYLHFGVAVTLIYGMFQDMGHAVFVLLICIVTYVWSIFNMACTMSCQLNQVYQ